MNHTFCPGARILRQPAPETFTCPSCGGEVEIWTDEPKRTCPNCRTPVYRDAGMSCLDWCKRGKECVGDSIYDNYMRNKAVGLKKHLLAKMREHFGGDTKKTQHAEKVLDNAEKLVKSEKGDWHIVIPASILHEVGIAREILLRLGLKLEDINEICDIIAHHHSKDERDSDNYRLLCDADWLANLREVADEETDEQLRRLIDEIFLTETGRDLALKECAGLPVEQHSKR